MPVAVVIFSLVGSVLFSDVQLKYFEYKIPGSGEHESSKNLTMDETAQNHAAFQMVNFSSLRVTDIFGAMGLGFSLSLLFFMDQNIR